MVVFHSTRNRLPHPLSFDERGKCASYAEPAAGQFLFREEDAMQEAADIVFQKNPG